MATYALIPTPPGDWKNSIYDLHAIRMAAQHNILIRSFNSIIFHAPNIESSDVPSFIKYCCSVVAMVHEHHTTEEEVIFPFFESKLGAGAMDGNLAQHHDFTPKFNEWSQHCQNIQQGSISFDGRNFVALMRESTDILVPHLTDEIPTMESSILQQQFSESELKSLEISTAKKIRGLVSLWDLPLLFVNGDLEYNSWFPPIPAPVVFIARHAIMNRSGDVWKYGQADKYSKLKPEFKPMYSL
ncbi:hypothetical protein BDV93DRAFT_603026 [Ceratobasidium sp. AG-I]|nr:hypothetical protein BDV93DRAFT_603026 [Ceratobasidium sp. AG-I]